LINALWKSAACALAFGLTAVPSSLRAECDPTADWTAFGATGDISEILVRDGIAWVAAVGGLIRFDLSTAGAEEPGQRRITGADGLASTNITTMAIDGFGNVWVGTRENGVSVFGPAGNHVANLDSFNALWSDLVVAIGADGDRVFVQSADGDSPQGAIEGGGFVIITIVPDGSGYRFEPLSGPELEAGRFITTRTDEIWFATSGRGVWKRDETVSPPSFAQVLTTLEGLASNNVRKLVFAPRFGSATDVLWIGSTEGLQSYDGTSLDTPAFFQGNDILDVHRAGNELYVIRENDFFVRDLYRVDLTTAFAPQRVGRITCMPDTLYSPREVGVGPNGEIVLGTQSFGIGIRQGSEWSCPPPLGPHSAFVSDLKISSDGTLYFGAGNKDPTGGQRGVGMFDGTTWDFLNSQNSQLLANRVTEIAVWPDSTAWFGTTVNLDLGGVNRYYPKSDSLVAYHDDVVVPARQTLGRNCWALEVDASDNLWSCYGQANGGLSCIEYPSEQITNFPFATMFSGRTTLLRDLAFDTFGRVWVSTFSSGTIAGQIYVVDTRGTISNRSDDILRSFNLASEVADIGEIRSISIDSTNQVWLAGEAGLAVGQITDSGNAAAATWTLLPGTTAQLGGRNPLPYRCATLDWDENIWLGTESAGLLRISKDRSIWTWFDQLEGCPLPDQGVFGIYSDDVNRTVYVGTARGGIAVIQIDENSARASTLLAPFPNPWNPTAQGALTFDQIPITETTTMRMYTIAGDLVAELADVRGPKTWDGRTAAGQFVESGVYLISATSTAGTGSGATVRYEGKVAVVR
jgi:ligand-binding sensor domain-containing protein